MTAAIVAIAASAGVLGVLSALDARDRRAAGDQRHAETVLCSGRDCDIAPSLE